MGDSNYSEDICIHFFLVYEASLICDLKIVSLSWFRRHHPRDVETSALLSAQVYVQGDGLTEFSSVTSRSYRPGNTKHVFTLHKNDKSIVYSLIIYFPYPYLDPDPDPK